MARAWSPFCSSASMRSTEASGRKVPFGNRDVSDRAKRARLGMCLARAARALSIMPICSRTSEGCVVVVTGAGVFTVAGDGATSGVAACVDPAARSVLEGVGERDGCGALIRSGARMPCARRRGRLHRRCQGETLRAGRSPFDVEGKGSG